MRVDHHRGKWTTRPPGVRDMFCSPEKEIWAGLARESKDASQGSNGGVREKEVDEGRAGTVSAMEKLRRAWLDSELLMNTSNE